jgi:hypothetical protein
MRDRTPSKPAEDPKPGKSTSLPEQHPARGKSQYAEGAKTFGNVLGGLVNGKKK